MNIWCISKYSSPTKYSKLSSKLYILAKEFVKFGNNVTFITSNSNHLANYPKTENIYNYEVEDNISICWIKTKQYKKTASISRVLSWFDFEFKLFKMDIKKFDKPDVIIVSSLSLFSIIYGYYLKKRFGSFLIFEIRDIWPLTLTEEGGFSKWHPLVLLMGIVEKFGYKKSDLVVGTMPRLDIHIKNILGYEKPFYCSAFGFEPKNFDEAFLKNKNPFDELFPKDKIIVGYSGSMGISNDLDNFIQAIKILDDNKQIYFMIVGSGDLKDKYQKELENCSNVTFLPRIEQNEVKYFLAKCDILYLSTKDSKVWDYGQSMNKVVEYMLSAKPIIAMYSGYPSMINEANCGIFVSKREINDIKESILNMASLSKTKRDEMGERGKKWIWENREYSKLAKDYLEKIKEEMNNKYA